MGEVGRVFRVRGVVGVRMSVEAMAPCEMCPQTERRYNSRFTAN